MTNPKFELFLYAHLITYKFRSVIYYLVRLYFIPMNVCIYIYIYNYVAAKYSHKEILYINSLIDLSE